MPKRESCAQVHWIDLYRDNGQLLRADNDEPYLEMEGMEVIPHDEPAALRIEYDVHSWYEKRTWDYPGGHYYETELKRVRLQVGSGQSMQYFQLPKETQKAVWDGVWEEVTP